MSSLLPATSMLNSIPASLLPGATRDPCEGQLCVTAGGCEGDSPCCCIGIFVCDGAHDCYEDPIFGQVFAEPFAIRAAELGLPPGFWQSTANCKSNGPCLSGFGDGCLDSADYCANVFNNESCDPNDPNQAPCPPGAMLNWLLYSDPCNQCTQPAPGSTLPKCPVGSTYDPAQEKCVPIIGIIPPPPKCDCPAGEYVANNPNTDNGCLVGDSIDPTASVLGCPDCCIPKTVLPPPCVCITGAEPCCNCPGVTCQRPFVIDNETCSCFCPCERNKVSV